MKRTLAGLTLALALATAAQAQEKGLGPASLIIFYKCPPEHRPAFRGHMSGPGVQQFEAWKKSGAFRDYLVLFSSLVNTSRWDMLVRLDFDRYVDTANWREIEKTAPGGLSAEGLALCSPSESSLADLTWSGAAAERNPAKAVYYVIPYSYSARAVYKTYVDAYVTPQTKGWIREGVLSSFGIYLNQNDTGPVWDSLFILEYKDLASLAQRRTTIAKVREELGKDPAWKMVSEAKHDFRTEGETVIADAIVPR